VDFPDQQHGWIMVLRGVGAGQAQFEIYRTSNAGASWKRVMIAGQQNPTSGGLPGCNCINGISFGSPRDGWATGQFFAGPTAVYLFRSRDEGHTWQRHDLAVPAHYPLMGIMTEPPIFFSASDGFLPVFLSVKTFVVYTTHDGGASWRRTTPIKFSPTTGSFYSFLAPADGWFTDGARLWSTHDGGGSWTAIRPSHALRGPLQFVTRSTGFELYTNGVPGGSPTSLYETLDGGRNWTQLRPAMQGNG
jgi:photosystem II stability/assembly factor-like uncharacterized protein